MYFNSNSMEYNEAVRVFVVTDQTSVGPEAETQKYDDGVVA